MIRNDFGPIARTYEELQSLPTLAQSQLRCPVRPTSRAAFDRAVLQSVEIALYNVADLLTRATADLRKGDVGRAGLKAAWLHGFQKVITQLLVGYKQLPFRSNRPSVPLSLPDVAPYQSALAALKSFDAAVVSTVGYERFTNILGSGNLDDPTFRLLHSVRISNHEMVIWDEMLRQVRLSVKFTYQQLVCPDIIEAAIFERQLRGDTFFTQFRAVHQIPEVLGIVINAQLEMATTQIRRGHALFATLCLHRANLLCPAVLACLTPLTECLTEVDYHQIRENLGATSGSHSTTLNSRLLNSVYEELACAVRNATASPTGRWVPCVLQEAEALRAFVHHWRLEHIHLPRNNLGGNYTRSLIGSPDAVKAVETMVRSAQSRDPLAGSGEGPAGEPVGGLLGYIAGDNSLDRAILNHAGEATKARFPHVQSRTGLYKKP